MSSDLTQQLEAILFVASEPVSIEQLAAACQTDADAVTAALDDIATHYTGRGLRLQTHQGMFRLVTAPAVHETVRRFLLDETKTELTKPALETLAIVAYRGPITKLSIEEIRGVASETMLRNLLQRGLIIEHGPDTSEPGQPMRYIVSHIFFEEFGLTGTEQLPPLDEAGDTRED